MSGTRRWIMRIAVLGAAAAGVAGWWALTPEGLPPGIARGNGRVEAVEIDICTKTPGRISEILVNESDFVTVGQVVARMDTAVLEAQLREDQAQLQRAVIGVQTANSQVTQREAQKVAAEAVVVQRDAQATAAYRRLARTEELASRGNAPLQTLDDHRAAYEGARAALSAARARAQVAAEDAAISASHPWS